MIAQVFDNPSGRAARRLVKLQRQHAELVKRERDLDADAARWRREVDRLDRELVEVYADDGLAVNGNPPASGSREHKVRAELAKAQAKRDEDWGRRAEGLRRRAERVQAEIEDYVREHFDELAGELAPEAQAAQERLEVALRELGEAERAWHATSGRFAALLGPIPGIDGRDLPMLTLDSLRSEVKGALARGVPAPIPRSLSGARQDPTIKGAA